MCVIASYRRFETVDLVVQNNYEDYATFEL